MENSTPTQCVQWIWTISQIKLTDFQLLYRFVDFLKYKDYPIELDAEKVTVENCKKALELFKKD